jgi:ribosomal protein S18 acetylase RimI-like enzyme
MTAEPCEMLPWDTEYFGFPIARVTATTLTPPLWREVEQWCAARGVRCLYCFLQPDFRSARIVESAGGNLVNVRMNYERREPVRLPAAVASNNRVREGGDGDMPALERIAATSHRGRFHHDERFDPAKADELYCIWIRKGRLEIKDHVLVADDAAGVMRGYCACAIKTLPAGDRIGFIEIIGVDEAARGQGIGRDLLVAALAYFAANGLSTVRLVTQAENIVAQRLYQRFGFLVTDCELIYHKWFDAPAVDSSGGDAGGKGSANSAGGAGGGGRG